MFEIIPSSEVVPKRDIGLAIMKSKEGISPLEIIDSVLL